MSEGTVHKVWAYVTRPRGEGLELLVFEHPEEGAAGWQVPGGTVDAGESLGDALLREVAEETGLSDLAVNRCFVAFRRQVAGVNHFYYLYHLEAPPGLPDTWSHTVTAGEEDAGFVFLFRWMPLDAARSELVPSQGEWVPLLPPEGRGAAAG